MLRSPSRFTAIASPIVLALLATAASVGPARAHDEPRRARTVKAPLITAYEPCTAPNTVTAGVAPLPACTPPVRSDDLCGFQGPTFGAGFGRASGKTASTGDFRLDFVAKNLGPGCEGWRLCAVVSLRITTERCAVPPCTIELPRFSSSSSTACCTVTNGQCRVQTSVNSEILGVLQPGEKTGIAIRECGLRRVDGPNPPAEFTFVCGVLAP